MNKIVLFDYVKDGRKFAIVFDLTAIGFFATFYDSKDFSFKKVDIESDEFQDSLARFLKSVYKQIS